VLGALPPLLRSTATFFALLAIVGRLAIHEVQADADDDAHEHHESREQLEEKHGISLYAAALTELVNFQLPTPKPLPSTPAFRPSELEVGSWRLGVDEQW
jgi:hypothetical protein